MGGAFFAHSTGTNQADTICYNIMYGTTEVKEVVLKIDTIEAITLILMAVAGIGSVLIFYIVGG